MPTGIVADLYSRRLSLVIAGVVMGAGMLVVGLVRTWRRGPVRRGRDPLRQAASS